MRKYILDFCNEFDYPEQAVTDLLDCFDKITADDNAKHIFVENVERFNRGEFKDKGGELDALEPLQKHCRVNLYTVHLLFFICLSKNLRNLYKQHNIDYKIFYDSMCDLKWKLLECHNLYGIWGSFVAWWFSDFFYLKRFALGRLQFELAQFNGGRYEKQGYVIRDGDTVINTHIPSSGPLKHDECLKSYAAAADFFNDSFKSGVTAFVCDSWLLNPDHELILPADSNILRFKHDFEVIRSAEDKSCNDAWRVFNKPYDGNIDALPENTFMQRAYKKWFLQGNKFGTGYGVFFFADNKIV